MRNFYHGSGLIKSKEILGSTNGEIATYYHNFYMSVFWTLRSLNIRIGTLSNFLVKVPQDHIKFNIFFSIIIAYLGTAVTFLCLAIVKHNYLSSNCETRLQNFFVQ